ncbi:MAG: UDP-glucose--hexose-1-phosphate uridylyltransferase [Chloroflexi bacterium]|nr:UDP-glucose--hexose-1-phosphate uridylyltransferase [Chloroflexota bacterium]
MPDQNDERLASLDLLTQPHRRFSPLTGEWILVSPHRTQRPWLGQVEKPPAESRPQYDADCYLCPGNARAAGAHNPIYEHTFVFDNDFASLLPGTSAGTLDRRGLIRAASERGVCRVICFSPRHDLTLPDMPLGEIRRVVDTWVDQTAELGALDFIRYVQLFENKGAAMGASNPHPHCQVWAEEHVPTEPAKEQRSSQAYGDAHGTCMLCDYLALELEAGERIVLENQHYVALVPFWAVWPCETLVLSRRHVGSLTEIDPTERDGLADMVKRLTTRYDNLFETSFPYSMGFHQSPSDGAPHPESHLHAHYYPPLLRNATVRKFMVGYEMMANPQRDLTAERAAARLREVSEKLYRGP